MATLQTSPVPAEAPAPLQPVAAFPTRADKAQQAPARLVSLDAYRGFIMLVMASGGFAFASVAHRLDVSVLSSSTAGLVASPAVAGPLPAVTTPVPDRAERPPASRLLSFLGHQFDHVPWVGCAFWDLIQPSFMFMVGVALPYSFASRRNRGESYGKMLAHAVWRAFVLILLAIFLSS